ncbi:MAG: EAL domain-containing protein [Chloroflexota bacterium]
MNQETILVIDDNRQLGDFIAYRLLPNMGYHGRIAYTGKSGLEAARARSPELILLDLELPDMTGLDILRQLNQEGLRIPTILFTAHGSEQVAAEAFRLGVHDYLIKPVEPEKLEAAIADALTETRLRQEMDRLNGELKEQVNWLSALSKVGQSLTALLDLDEVLRRITDSAVELTQAEEGFIALLDPASGQFYLRAVKSIDETLTATARLPVQDALVGMAIRSGRPVRRSIDGGGEPIKISTGFLVVSLLYVPIFSRGRPLGVLGVDNRQQRRYFSARDEVVLTSLVDYAAVALENASLFDQARREIAERRRMETALRESEERYALAVNGANDGLWDWNLRNNHIYYSPRWKKMLGYNEDEIRSDPQEWLGRVHPDDLGLLKAALTEHLRGETENFDVEHRVRTQSGAYCWMLCRGVAVRAPDKTASRIAGSLSDISASKAAAERLRHDAFTDSLTQLPNRAHFLARLSEALRRSGEQGAPFFAVLFLDLDGFKYINDSLGHPAGDELLIAVTEILKSELRSQDCVARLGGDEFVILLDRLSDSTYPVQVSKNIIDRLARPIYLEPYHTNVTTSTSIGIVLSLLGYEAADDMLRDADIAMYAAKAHGKGCYELYDPQMRAHILQRLALESDLVHAVEQNQLLMFYQPLVSLDQGRLVGFEALVQWQHPEHGLLPASEFIPLAQETGLIGPIDWWVFAEACSQARRWQTELPSDPPLRVFVHLTSSLIARHDLLDTIHGILEKSDLDPHLLGLVIKETITAGRGDNSARIINELCRLGIMVHIDNFGTGSGSLLTLKRFPVDGLKIARGFVADLERGGMHTTLVQNIVNLAHSLGMTATAEGIETEGQLRLLQGMKCDIGQGYLFSPPVRAGRAGELILACHNGQRPLSYQAGQAGDQPLRQVEPDGQCGQTPAPKP